MYNSKINPIVPEVTNSNWATFKTDTSYFDVNKKINESAEVMVVCKKFSKLIFDLVINWTNFWNEFSKTKNPSYINIDHKQSVYNFFYKRKNSSKKLFWSGQVYNSIEKTPDEVYDIVNDILNLGNGNIREQVFLWELFYTDCYFNFDGTNKGTDNIKRDQERFGETPGIFWTIILWVSILIEDPIKIPEVYKIAGSLDFISKLCIDQLKMNKINLKMTINKIEYLVNFLGVNSIFDIIQMKNKSGSKQEIILESDEKQNFPSLCHYSRPFPLLRAIIHDINIKLRIWPNYQKENIPLSNLCNNPKSCTPSSCKTTKIKYIKNTSSTLDTFDACLDNNKEISNLSKTQQIDIATSQIPIIFPGIVLDSIELTDKNKNVWIVDLSDRDYNMKKNRIPSLANTDLMIMGCPLSAREISFMKINNNPTTLVPWDVGQYSIIVNKDSFFYKFANKDKDFIATGVSGHSWMIMDILSNFEEYNSLESRKKSLLAIISYLLVPLHHTYYEVRWGTDYIGIPYDPEVPILDDVEFLLGNTPDRTGEKVSIPVMETLVSNEKQERINILLSQITRGGKRYKKNNKKTHKKKNKRKKRSSKKNFQKY